MDSRCPWHPPPPPAPLLGAWNWRRFETAPLHSPLGGDEVVEAAEKGDLLPPLAFLSGYQPAAWRFHPVTHFKGREGGGRKLQARVLASIC